MRRLTETVWLVLSAEDDDVAGDVHDGNGYLVWDGTRGVLVDAGTGLDSERWLREVAAIAPLEALEGVLITHYHADHAGGAAAAGRAGLQVLGSVETVAALASADEVVTSLAVARDAGVYPADYRLDPWADATVVAAGATVAGVRVLDAPGHCDGHVVGAIDAKGGAILLTGDVLFPGGLVSIQALHDCRLDRYAATVQALAYEQPIALLGGHGEPELDAGRALTDARAAAETFARLVPPPNRIA